jgi:hypothetical protein
MITYEGLDKSPYVEYVHSDAIITYEGFDESLLLLSFSCICIINIYFIAVASCEGFDESTV